MKIFRGSAKTVVEMTAKSFDRKSLKKMTTKNTGPGSFQ